MNGILTAKFANGSGRSFKRDGWFCTDAYPVTVSKQPGNVLEDQGFADIAVGQDFSQLAVEILVAVIWRDLATGYRFGLKMYIGQGLSVFGNDPYWLYMHDKEKAESKGHWIRPENQAEPFKFPSDDVIKGLPFAIKFTPTVKRSSLNVYASLRM